jgi:hypothetical protein
MPVLRGGTAAHCPASWHVDAGTIGQRDHGADTGDIIVPDDGQQAAMQDAELLANDPPPRPRELPLGLRARSFGSDSSCPRGHPR